MINTLHFGDEIDILDAIDIAERQIENYINRHYHDVDLVARLYGSIRS
jgi:hypothetical protein